ncbi:MAG: hypothetical protein LBB20_02935 [Puniceicoccales bacterium]|nr:hypothetical protein [Puniceicoccales bacterium]
MNIRSISILALLYLCYFSPCGGDTKPKKAVMSQGPGADATRLVDFPHYGKKDLTIFVITWRGETEAELGFFDRLKELGYDAKYIVFDAGKSAKSLKKFLSTGITTDRIDYVYTFGTVTSLMVSEKLNNSIPHVFNIVSFPEKCGLINSNSEYNGGNLSGVKCSVSIESQINNAVKFLKFKKLGVFVSTKEQSCVDSYYQIVESSKNFGFVVQRIDVNKGKDLMSIIFDMKTNRAMYKVDALFLTASSLFASNIKEIVAMANELKIPLIAETEEMVAGGALMGTTPDYNMAGRTAADIIEINQFGVKMGYIPVKRTATHICVNRETMKALGLECGIPGEVYYGEDK